MAYGSAPKAPDPQETAAAQTATNVSTAIANSYLGNINQITPDGSLNYSKTGQQFINDPNGEKYWVDSAGKYTTTKPSNMKGYTQVEGYYVPTFTATQTLSPQQQAIKTNEDKAQQHLAATAREQSWKLRNLLNDTVDTSGLPKAVNWEKLLMPDYQTVGSGPQNLTKNIKGAGNIQTSYVDDFSADRQRVEDALMSRLNPQLEQDRAALESRLVNQGLQPGSEAYNRAIDEASRASTDARLGAILSAGQEQSRLAGLARDQATFGNAAQAQQYSQNANNAQFSNSVLQQIYDNQLKGAGFNNSVEDQDFNAKVLRATQRDNSRQRALQEQFALRNQPINEISSLLSGAQVTQPNFMNIQGASIPTVDYAGIVQQNYANEMGAYNAQQANLGGLLGGIGSILALSDDRTKKNKKKIGKAKGAMNLWEFNYKDEPEGTPPHFGLMASEVEKEKPSAIKRKNGLRFVDYGKALAS